MAGFEDFEITWRSDHIFDGALRPSTDAVAFGTMGINFRARKPVVQADGAIRIENEPIL
jgi:hypothetical protein